MQFVTNQPNFFTIIHNYYCSPVSPVNSFQEMEEAERLAAAAVDDDDEPGEVGGDNSKKINNKNKKKKKSIAQRKANAKKPQTGSGDLTSKVFATMEKHKEVFFTIRLHSAQSAASLGPIHDPDPLMQVQGEKVRFQTKTFDLSHTLNVCRYLELNRSLLGKRF